MDWRSSDIDFTPIYAAASLGPVQAMDADQMAHRIQPIGPVIPARHLWSRLPAITLLYSPLSRLDYPQARLLWRILCGLFLCAWALIWSRWFRLSWVTLIGFLPALYYLVHGQDSGLCLMAATLPLLSPGIMSGMLFGVCLAKFHLFLFLPAALLARREWKLICGGAAGCAAVVAASFAVAGLAWPQRLVAIASSSEFSPYSEHSPGLRLLFVSHPALFAALAVATLAGVYWISRRISTPSAVAVALAAGLVVNSHSYVVDCVLLLPLIAVGLASDGPAYGLSLFLLSPASYWSLLVLSLGAPLRLAVALLGARPVNRAPKLAPDPRPAEARETAAVS